MSKVFFPQKHGRPEPLNSSKEEILSDSEITSRVIDRKNNLERIISFPKKSSFLEESLPNVKFESYEFLNLRPGCIGISFAENEKCNICQFNLPCKMTFDIMKEALLRRALQEKKVTYIKPISSNFETKNKVKKVKPAELYLMSLSSEEREIIEKAIFSLKR